MKKVNSTVNDKLGDSSRHSQMEISDANLIFRSTPDNQRAKHRAHKKKINLRKKSLYKQANGHFKTNSNFQNHNNHGQQVFSTKSRFRMSREIPNSDGNYNIRDITCLACGKAGHSWNKCWDHAKKTLFVRRNPNIVAGCQKINILLTKINVPKNEKLLGGV